MIWTYAGERTLTTATWTGPQLAQAIKAAILADFGVSPFDENLGVSSVDSLIYEIPGNNAAAFDKAYLNIEVVYTSTPVIRTSIGTAWNATTNTGTNFSTALSSSAIPTSQNLIARSYTGPEGKLMAIRAGSGAWAWIGWLRPQTLPGWWDEDATPAIFTITPVTATAGAIVNTGLIAPSNTIYSPYSGRWVMPAPRVGNPDGIRACITPYYFAATVGGKECYGPQFNDFASVAGDGLNRGEVISVGSEDWMIMEQHTIQGLPFIAMRLA
jgi:hypothetical protein